MDRLFWNASCVADAQAGAVHIWSDTRIHFLRVFRRDRSLRERCRKRDTCHISITSGEDSTGVRNEERGSLSGYLSRCPRVELRVHSISALKSAMRVNVLIFFFWFSVSETQKTGDLTFPAMSLLFNIPGPFSKPPIRVPLPQLAAQTA